MTTTRRLDDTYYAILEKVSNLRSMIEDLHNLSQFTKNLHHDFSTDSSGLQTDIQGQIDRFGGFKEQQNRIGDFEDRLKASKEKAENLQKRLETAKATMEAREKSEEESQAKASREYRQSLWPGKRLNYDRAVESLLRNICCSFLRESCCAQCPQAQASRSGFTSSCTVRPSCKSERR